MKIAKTTTLILILAVVGGTVFAQSSKRQANPKLKMKTARLHIDGFSKSKSGAV